VALFLQPQALAWGLGSEAGNPTEKRRRDDATGNRRRDERRADGVPGSGAGYHRHQRRSPMKRVAFILKVKADKIDEYRERHRAVWPDMLDALRRTGWHNYSLFLRDDGLLFGYFEADESFQASLDGMAREEVNARWQASMAPFFENLGGSRPDQGMLELEEVFHLP